jgi:hypothetical protein
LFINVKKEKMVMALKKSLTTEQKAFLSAAFAKYGPTISRKQVLELSKESSLPVQRWLLRLKEYRSKRGTYNLETILAASEVTTANASPTAKTASVSA